MSQASDLQTRLSYLNLRESDRELLAAMRPVFEKHADTFVAAFYRHLLSFSETRDLLRDPRVKEHLLAEQKSYLLSLAGRVLDDTYIADRRRIGETHKRIGLEPRWYLGAYSLYMSFLTPLIQEGCGADTRRAVDTALALGKVLLLDAQIAMETYIEGRQRELEFLTEELAREGRRLAIDYEDQSAELRQTEDRARVAEELASVATLVAGLAHEIGTPMGVIQGHAKLLERSVQGDDARWRLETIQTQVVRISKIIQTLLNMARPGKLRRTPLALAPLLEASLAFVEERLGRHNIRLVTAIDDVPSISGDAERLQQLCLNLFLNATDAMPDGGELRVSLRALAGEAELRIADDGAGIAAADLEKIFDPFFTTKAAGEGNGLGLMVSKGIVVDHGGTIEVTSAPGEGTEFRIRFPLAARESTPKS